MRTYFRTLKTTSVICLAFYLWTFGGPLYAPFAYAATGSQGLKGQKAEHSGQARQQTTEEKFQESLDRIREAGADRAKIKTERDTLTQLNEELQKQFQKTEEKIKGLSEVVKQRHRDFTKKYAANMNTLKRHLSTIEQAKSDVEVKAATEKAKAFLESVRPQKRHIALDPDRLPVSARKAKAPREPRTKEQFEKDFPKQKSQTKQKIADSRLLPELLASAPKPKPILLAFNGTTSDVPFSFGVQPLNPQSQIAFSESSPLLLAQATSDLPAPEDLSENGIDIQFTQPIRDLAAQLGYSPVRIYEWVRNNTEFAPTYGSIQGADVCLQSKICNDFDTASLLIALLRISGIYAHYVYGTVDIPMEKAMNWVGGVTDPKMVGTIFATNGVPVTLLKTSSGVYKYARIEHVWVSAFIDYIPSRGSVHKQGDTFIPLDPSFKQYNYTTGIDINSAVPFDAQTFANQILSTATTNTTEGYVTNVNSTLVQQTVEDYQAKVQNYIQQNYPNATVGDVIGNKEIIKQEFGILPETLPYKTVQVGAKFAQVPDNLRATLSFSIPDAIGTGTGLSYTTSLPQIAGKKITLSFAPATANDQAVIESLLPQPHADGTPIQPSEFPSSFPAYLIILSPELRIDGRTVATGSSLTMGTLKLFTLSLVEPGIGLSKIENIVQSGEFYGICLDTGRMGILKSLQAKLEVTKTNLMEQNYLNITKEDIVGDLLYATIASYFAHLDMNDEINASIKKVIRYRTPSVGMFSLPLDVADVFGMPNSARSRGLMMDVDRVMQAVFSKDGQIDKVTQYMISSGSISSALEHAVPEELYSQPNIPIYGISAVKALQIANDQAIPIYTIDESNINSILPQLEIDLATKNDIVNAVNAGKEVIVSKSNIYFNGWRGCGYIITDPITGAGAYMISGGANGVWITMAAALIFLIAALATAAFLAGAAALILAALLVFIGLMFLFGEMYFTFGPDNTNKFLGCISELAAMHYFGGKVLHRIGDFIDSMFRKLWHVYSEAQFSLIGIYEFSHCLDQLIGKSSPH